MLPSLYPQQTDVLERLRASLAVHRASILCAQTGFGKSRVAKWILGKALEREATQYTSGVYLIAVHRRGLVDNLAKNLAEDPALRFGIIMSKTEDSDPGARIQLASIDSLNSWYITDGEYTGPSFDMVIFDECHSHLSKLRTFLEPHQRQRNELGYKPPLIIGLSATPQCDGLADVFRDIVSGPTPDWLIENGYAAPYRYMSGRKGRLGMLVRNGNEFTSQSVDAAMERLAGDFIRDWRKYADGRPTVGFFPRRTHAQEAMVALQKKGIEAEYLDGETPDDERRTMFRCLGNGAIQYIANVGVIERGTDIPEIGCVQLCTAVGSLVRYRQMIGRGSRTAEGKTDCLILDHGGNIQRHGFFEDDIKWTLDRSSKETREHADRPPVECPKCGRMYRGGKCLECGHEPTVRQLKAQGLSFDGRPLEEVKREERREKALDPEEIMVTAMMIAGKTGKTVEQAAWIAKSIAQNKGVAWRTPRRMRLASGKTFDIPWGTPEAKLPAWEVFPWTGRKR